MTIPGIPANTIYQTYTEIQMLQPPNQSTGDRYGCDIALSGNKNILLIGSQDEDGSAPSHDGNGTYNDDSLSSGAVYIYNLVNDQYVLSKYLKSPTPDVNIRFGWAVEINELGNIIAVTGKGYDSNNGSIYIYEYINNDWQFREIIEKPADIDFEFGIRIKLNRLGNKLYISSNIWQSTRTFHEYEYINNSWTRTHTFINDGSDDKFGCNFDLNYNEDILVIGADKALNNNKRGAVYVFNKNNGTWGNYIAYLQGTSQGGDDYFGSDVKISGDGNTIIVIAYNNPSNLNYHKGAVFVFNLINGSWTETNVIKLPLTYDESNKIYGGISINYYGNLITFSGYHLNNKGRIYIAYLDNSNWIISSYIESSIPLDNSYFGAAFFGTDVIQVQEKLIISEQARNNYTGAVYVFDGAGAATGGGSPNIIATGAPLQIIPNFNLNKLIK